MTQDIDNTQDILDSRDVIARFEELESEREALVEAVEEVPDDSEEDPAGIELLNAQQALCDWDAEYRAELKALSDFISEGSDEWRHGGTLIRDSYFEDYARELAEEIGATDEKAAHGRPLNCIDWEQAARELQMDYTSADFDGVTYWYRG